MNEAGKMQFAAQQPGGYKMDPSPQDIDGALKTKKVKLNRGDIEVKRIPEANFKSSKNNIKNTYINKINSLITDPKVASPEHPKPYILFVCGQVKNFYFLDNQVRSKLM